MHWIKYNLKYNLIKFEEKKSNVTCPFWSAVLFVNLSLLNNNDCFINCAPVELLSGWG
jgi:hypothetical protein